MQHYVRVWVKGLGESAGAGGGRRGDWDVVQGAAGVIFDNLKREVGRSKLGARTDAAEPLTAWGLRGESKVQGLMSKVGKTGGDARWGHRAYMVTT